MKTRFAVAVLLGLLPLAPARAGTVVAFGEDMGFFKPEVDDKGLVAVIPRGFFVEPEGPGCALEFEVPQTGWTAHASDFVVLDLTEGCGNDLLRESNALSLEEFRDPSITSDGNIVAFWRPSPAGAVFTLSDTDLATRDEVYTDDTTTSAIFNLEISGTGAFLVYRRFVDDDWYLVRVDLAESPAVATVLDEGEIELNDTRCIADDGTVFYSKKTGSSTWEVSMFGPTDTAPSQPLTGLGGDEHFVSTSRDGTVLGFEFKTGSEKDAAVAAWDGTSWSVIRVATPTDTAWSLSELTISGDGGEVVFVSDGDFDTGNNEDGSEEVFRVKADASESPHQVTALEKTTHVTGFVHGITTSFDGKVILYGMGQGSLFPEPPCKADEFHTLVVNYESLDTTPFSQTTTSDFVGPPFEMLAGTCTDNTGTTGTWDCTATLRGSQEAERNVLVLVEYVFGPDNCAAGRLDRQPVPILLEPGDEWDIADSLDTATEVPCTSLDVTFRVSAISPDVAQADKATTEIPFTVVP